MVKLLVCLTVVFGLLGASTAVDPVAGWNAFVQACAQNGGPSDYARQYEFNGTTFVPGAMVRFECGEAEMFVPFSWMPRQ